ncbi:MAG: succinate dehydrogenase, hydrophobic membrane anchor protein [Pseudomonadota bacterium]
MRSPVDSQGKSLRGGHRTALKSIRYLGSAREGTQHFIQQRMTALANFFLVIVLAIVAIAMSGKTYPEAVAMIGSPFVGVPLALAIVSICLHMKLGVQVVIEDYVHAEGPRIVLLVLNTFFALVLAAAGLFAIVKIMLAAVAAGA